MLKIFLVLLVASTVLIGCHDDNKTTNSNATGQVTEDMLIGVWQCKTTVAKYGKYDENGNLQEPMDITSSRTPIRASYKKESNSLTLTVDDFNNIPFSLNDERYGKFQKIGECINDNVSDIKVEPNYIFISNDEFIVTSAVESRTCKSKKLFENIYTEQNCKRDK